jgi:geranylgeranyl transferase type-2 subunit alpha
VVENIEKTRGKSLAQAEFEYTTAKTNNISNFSAWHNRANLIPQLLPQSTSPDLPNARKKLLHSGPPKSTTTNAELERTHNGLWVDPADQSTWLYHSWLVGETFSLHPGNDIPAILAPTSPAEKVQVLRTEIAMLEELLVEEPDAKCISRGRMGGDLL